MSTPDSETDRAIGQLIRRSPRISREDVFQAADALLLQGDRPTIDRVRMKLGRGSPNTINDHLDAWWARLGARLRDVPGQELPHLPDGLAHRLTHLWHEALDAARETLQESLAGREAALAQREQAFAERERAALERSSALEEGLALAREQLTAANERAAALEAQLTARSTEAERLHAQLERSHKAAQDAQIEAHALTTAHAAERAELLVRSTQAEQHWMLELDRARQTARESAQRHEQAMKGLQRQMDTLQSERTERTRELSTLRADLKAEQTAREQVEARLRTLLSRSDAPARAVVARLRKGPARKAPTKRAGHSARRKSPRS